MFEKRGREGQSRKCVGKTRSAEHSSPKKLCERALRRREYRRRRGITKRSQHKEGMKNQTKKVEKKERKRLKNGNSNTEGPDRQNQNNSNVEDTDEKDRTETFQTPNARAATDTQSENKEKNTLRKGSLEQSKIR